ncbi:hypothetical protein [Butyrivibrio sp.]|uniref:hypothetical protein n=1 Tax=Butyrivibrio sp. TaxID=28121 RepID=UPI0025BE9D9E|nr:hypothetical protein [Butyrivibrio sp.]MBQ7428362.1 hypothetical protein [Butyrivibrio sp.]MBQ9303666.1 hypothetical protein [Butyrivibrio sp.]
MKTIIDFDGKPVDAYSKKEVINMLTELKTEIEEIEVAKENTEIRAGECCMKGACVDLIQQKIDKQAE